jgi:hypothetical protein
MAALTGATEAAREGVAVVIVTMTEDAPSVMSADALDLRNPIAITDRADDLGVMTMTTGAASGMGIKTETDVARQVPESVSRARLPSHNLLRMSVTGEPFLSSNSPLVSAQKS